jgi:hypothetical protein
VPDAGVQVTEHVPPDKAHVVGIPDGRVPLKVTVPVAVVL